MKVILVLLSLAVAVVILYSFVLSKLNKKYKTMAVWLCVLGLFLGFNVYGRLSNPHYRIVERSAGTNKLVYVVQSRNPLIPTSYYNATGKSYPSDDEANRALALLELRPAIKKAGFHEASDPNNPASVYLTENIPFTTSQLEIQHFVTWKSTADGDARGQIFLMVKYCPDTLPYYMGLVLNAKQTFPSLDLKRITMGHTTVPTWTQGYTFISAPITGPKRKIEGYQEVTRELALRD